MANFNSNFYNQNNDATIEQAKAVMANNGYTNFSFKSVSRGNGASFYFTLENGQEVRVSDHVLTGKRAATTIQLSLYEVKKFEAKKATKPTIDIAAMIARRNAKFGEGSIA